MPTMDVEGAGKWELGVHFVGKTLMDSVCISSVRVSDSNLECAPWVALKRPACCPFTEPAGDRSEPHTAPNGIDPYEKDSEQSMDLTEAELMAILLPGGTALFHLRKAIARRRWRARFVSEVQGPIWAAVFSACIPRMGAREQ